MFIYFIHLHVNLVVMNYLLLQVAVAEFVCFSSREKLAETPLPLWGHSYAPKNMCSETYAKIMNAELNEWKKMNVNQMITHLQKEARSLVPKYSFSPKKQNFNKYFISMENLYSRVIECQLLKKFSDFTFIFVLLLKQLPTVLFILFNPESLLIKKSCFILW